MPVRGPLDPMELTIGDPERSVPSYAALLGALGFRRLRPEHPDFAGEPARRALFELRDPSGAAFFADPEGVKLEVVHLSATKP